MNIQCVYQIRFLKKFGINAITLYPFIFFAEPKNLVSERLFRHELQHIYQVQRLGWWRFYFQYLKAYATFRIQGLDHRVSYWNNPFEIDARENENQLLSLEEIEILKIKKIQT